MANSRDRRTLRRALQESGLGSLLKPSPPSGEEETTAPNTSKTPRQTAKPAKEKSRPQQSKGERSLSSRIPGWLWGTLVFLTLLITLLEGVPWLSVEENALLDPNNPYSALFYVVNDGYAPIADLDVDCLPEFLTKDGGEMDASVLQFLHFADYLHHSGKASIPCFTALSTNPQIPASFMTFNSTGFVKAELTVTISYSFYPLHSRHFRRHQSFRFHGVNDSSGHMQWTFIG
jgi:hypothetical protein